ncbi:MAG: hypothetical protein HY080_14145 [Gammaproteobacteria bacterium]|nr:hypothetical protein [Gammaproteobacteria bacterium]
MCKQTATALGLAVMLMAVWVVAYPAEALIDPTQPAGIDAGPTLKSHRVASPVWLLTATRISSDRRTAILNGQTVEVGATLHGVTVLRIEPGYVQLRRSNTGQQLRVELLPKEFKRVAQEDLHDH